ncbi:2,4-dichlorophenol 6-monooxygenase [Cladobotryum mycophilum]|uniref:2,4-dichlorophenol 6-monooxygenase n=1 Tax=Cladobotryum mycophilum TaxID=491253 RepID=A0ABR0SPY8_9HYPO
MINRSHDAVEVDFLVVGAGPAGASLACFLGQNGMKGLVISNASSTADTPRAHLMNPFGLECLRDLGLYEEAYKSAITGNEVRSQRWVSSMCGSEYGRISCYGGDPDNRRDITRASPCDFIDLPQTLLEPILIKYATQHNFSVRYSTELVALDWVKDVDDEGQPLETSTVYCTLQDVVTRVTYQARTRYVLGADGGRSTVARAEAAPFSFTRAPSFGVACNILLNADITHLVTPEREALLHWIMKPDQRSKFGRAPTLRMVKPWKQWLMVSFTPGVTPENDPFRDMKPDDKELISFIRGMIGDDSVDVEVLRVDPWVVRETVADQFSCAVDSAYQNVFLLGDVAHRHAPAYGLGSNICIQDAYNLGWKLAYVARGWAGSELLESYSAERQEVGARLVQESAVAMGTHARVWDALGMLAPTGEEGAKQIQELHEASAAGSARRAKLYSALDAKRREGDSLGLTMNQWYGASEATAEKTAVYLKDETQPRPILKGDYVVNTLITTYPGHRLPHAWLDGHASRRKTISTQDLAGHGAFCLLTSHGGEEWKKAAARITESTGIPIRAYGIGLGLDYDDIFRRWHQVREIGEDGCLLVRPDRFVAWRSMSIVEDCEGKLREVLGHILRKPISA